MPKLTLFGSHPDGKARCDNCRRVAGSLRQDGPGCAENDPSGAPLNEILKSVARRAPAYEDAAQTIGVPEHPRRQVRTGLTPQGPAARDAREPICP